MLATMHAAILLIGGKSERFLDPFVPKQFQKLSGKRVFEYALDTLLQSGAFSQILLPCHLDWIEVLRHELIEFQDKVVVFEGGNTRQHSVQKSLEYLDDSIKNVLIHDGARPFLSLKMIDAILEALATYPAAGTYIPSMDTIGVCQENFITEIPDRKKMVRGQTPQGFHKSLLFQAHTLAQERGVQNATCDVQLALQLQANVKKVDGEETNIKITTPIDLTIAEHLLRQKAPSNPIKTELFGKKIALIGASGGIGQHLHHELTQEGAEVIPLSRTSSPFAIDLTNPDSIQKTSLEIKKQFNELDGCVFSAGCLHRGSIESISQKKALEMVQVNFLSLIPLLQNLPLKKGALFILIGSSSYFRGRKEIGVYSATKAASINLLQSLQEERPDLKIQIYCPKRTLTPMRIKSFPEEDPASLQPPSKVAKSILNQVKGYFCTGEVLSVL